MPKTKDTALAELADLGKQLAAAAEGQEDTKATLDKILDTITGLDKEDAKALFRNEAVQKMIEMASEGRAQNTDDPPGTVYSGMIGTTVVPGFVKKPWTESDLAKLVADGKMTLVKNYRPITTQLIIWNGLRRQFVARRPITCPDCFVYVYEQHLSAIDLAEQHAAWLFKKTNHVDDSSILTSNGARARGTGTSGHYEPGGGNISGRAEEGEEATT